MNTKVFAIFDKTSFKEGIQRYFDVGREIGLVPLQGEIHNNDALVVLNRLYMMEHVYRKDVLHAVDLFHKSAITEKRVKQLYAYLGEMLCYWFIKEYGVVHKLQGDVKLIEFNTSWWERNKGDLISLGGLAASFVAAISGVSTTVAGTAAANTGSIGYETNSDISKQETLFESLQNAICGINFNIG